MGTVLEARGQLGKAEIRSPGRSSSLAFWDSQAGILLRSGGVPIDGR
jgi:hypothetical protein